MRRLLAAAVFAALFATAACGSGDDNASGDGGANGAATTTAAAAANTEQICADAKKVVADSTAKFSQEMSKVLTAAASGDKTAADDSVDTVKTMFTEWAEGMREQAEKASDAELKAALNDAADQISKVATSIKSANDLQQATELLDTPEFDAAGKKIESLCG